MAIVSAENINAQAQGFGSLSLFRQLGLVVGMALAIALGVTVAMWAQTPNYSLLYGNLTAKEMARVTSELTSANIEYKLEGGAGAILVPADKVQQARMKIAAKGISVGGDAGYELLEKEQGLGSSSFLQKARYHRAIEGELSKSIARLSFVEGARVHLAIPKQSAFARKSAKPTASVVLNLMPGRVLDDTQVAGIVNMVSSSVPGMENEAVTVIDQKGRLLSSPASSAGMLLSSTQMDYTRKLEERYVQRIIDIISPITGMDGVRAQVVADIDFTTQEETRESYSPDQKALRSEQLFEQSSDSSGASGVPGALSNQPPAGGTLEPVEKTEPAVATNNTSRAVRNYELDRTISHVRQSPMTLKKLSVAVVVDYKTVTDKKGNVTREPLSEEEIAHIKALVRETVGLDEARGDTVNVVNAPFQQPEEVEPLPEPPIWEQPWVWNVAKQVLGGLGVLLVIFGVLRPMLTNLAKQGEQAEKLAMVAALPEGQAGVEGAQGQLPDGTVAGNPALTHQPGQPAGQDLKEMATSLAKEDPQRVAQVMNTWVSSDE